MQVLAAFARAQNTAIALDFFDLDGLRGGPVPLGSIVFQWIMDGKLSLGALVSHRLPLDEVGHGFHL